MAVVEAKVSFFVFPDTVTCPKCEVVLMLVTGSFEASSGTALYAHGTYSRFCENEGKTFRVMLPTCEAVQV